MSNYIDSNEHKRAADKKCSDGLLLALSKAHGSPVKVEISDERPQVRLLQRQVSDLKHQIGDMQLVIDRQRKAIVKFGESDDIEFPKIGEICRAVCDYYRITKANLTGPVRAPRFALPRQIAYFLARDMTRCSLPEIGRRLGGKDHTSVLYGANKVQDLLPTDEILRDDIDVLKVKIGETVAARNVLIGDESAVA